MIEFDKYKVKELLDKGFDYYQAMKYMHEGKVVRFIGSVPLFYTSRSDYLCMHRGCVFKYNTGEYSYIVYDPSFRFELVPDLKIENTNHWPHNPKIILTYIDVEIDSNGYTCSNLIVHKFRYRYKDKLKRDIKAAANTAKQMGDNVFVFMGVYFPVQDVLDSIETYYLEEWFDSDSIGVGYREDAL